jgi:hypothetical protein
MLQAKGTTQDSALIRWLRYCYELVDFSRFGRIVPDLFNGLATAAVPFCSRIVAEQAADQRDSVEAERNAMSKNLTPRERIRLALGDRLREEDTERTDLPVGVLHEDAITIRGSVHIGTGAVISRETVDKELDRVLKD